MQWHERIGRRLKLRDLHILLAVVQHGSMAKAAAALAISQPAVSKAIADLGYEIVGGTPENMASMIQDEYKRWGPIVNASGAKVD